MNNLNWSDIHTVFLDMDGTLLDLHFDNYFWREHVPQHYAKYKHLSLEIAKEQFYAECKAVEGTLNWYCVDYWSEKLGLDIALLKEEVAHLIAEHPFVIEFLEAVKKTQRPIILVTNAHQKSIDLKMRKTVFGEYLDRVISSHEVGFPKEHPEFWHKLQMIYPFETAHTLLIDDSLPVLYVAQHYGVKHLLAVRSPDTKQPPRNLDNFEILESFADIIPKI
jgi:5'-nucleotidase